MLPHPSPSQIHRHSHHSLLHLLNHTTSITHTQVRQIHAHIIRLGLGRETTLLTSLLRHYTSQIPLTSTATTVFDQFPSTPPTFAWNLMIRAHTMSGSPVVAIQFFFRRMVVLGVPIDKFTLPFVVRAFSRFADLKKGKEVHGFTVKTDFYSDIFLQNGIVHLYLLCGDSESARRVFDKMTVRNVVSWTTLLSGLVMIGDLRSAKDVFDAMPVRNVVSWTAMIDGYAKCGIPEEAFKMFRSMLMEDVMPNEFTFVGLLVACTELGCLELGRWVHDLAQKLGGLERDVFVGTALIDMYSNCGSLEDALTVFDQMPVKSLATWNSMITSLGVHGHGRKAVALFEKMEKEAMVLPDAVTFKGVLCACLKDGLVSEGCRMFKHMIQMYGIVPTMEHWSSLTELLGVDDEKEIQLLIEDPSCFGEGKRWRKMVAACKANGRKN